MLTKKYIEIFKFAKNLIFIQSIFCSCMVFSNSNPASTTYVDNQIEKLPIILESQNWSSLCSNISIGCLVDPCVSSDSNCQKVMSTTGVEATTGVKFTASNGLFIKSFAPNGSSNSSGPLITTGTKAVACALYNTEGKLIPAQNPVGCIMSGIAPGTCSGALPGYSASLYGTSQTNAPYFLNYFAGSTTYYMMCLGISVNDNGSTTNGISTNTAANGVSISW